MLDRHILTFNENIIGLREFITLISPFIEEHHKKAVEEHEQIIESFKIAERIAVETDANQKEQIKTIFNGQLIEAIQIDTNNLIQDKANVIPQDELHDFFFAIPVVLDPRVEQAMKAPKKTNYQKELLYKNAFIGLLSSVEWFYSQVLHFYYDKHPDASGVKKKTLTLEELKSFNTVQDAERYLIDNKIEETFRGDLTLGWTY